MSPASRRRKSPKSPHSGQRVLRSVPTVPADCDCPECSGPEFDLAAFVAGLSTALADLLAADDPVDAELFGATLLAADLTEDIATELAKSPTPESLAGLLAIGALDDRVLASPLLTAGIAAPAWAAELAEPVTVELCRRYPGPTGETSTLMCLFRRSGQSHGFLVHVDHLDCDAAADIVVFAGETLAEATTLLRPDGAPVDLEPAEFRWQVERALNARTVHDVDLGTEDGPGYHPLAVLLRARMATLPQPARPPAAHGNTDQPPADA
jgi:hypothetical protein